MRSVVAHKNQIMKDDQIQFRILFRSPIYPVIVLAEDDIWPANNINELGSVCYVSEPPKDRESIKVVDSRGEEFLYLPDQVALTPGIKRKKWTKRQFIELFDNSETAKEKNLQYSQKLLPNKKLTTIVADICSVLRHNQALNSDG